MIESNSINMIQYVCPKCKHHLRTDNDALYCSECNLKYPVINNIPDFLSGDSQAGLDPVFGGTSGITTIKRMSRKMDFFAPVYDSRCFGSIMLKLSGISCEIGHFFTRQQGVFSGA